MNELLEMKHVAVNFAVYGSTVHAVRDVSFSMEEGQTVALVGESGCGKSITAKTIMGLVKKPGKVMEGSKILFGGTDITKYTEKEWMQFRGKECSMIFQDALVSLNPTMNIGRQIMESLDNHLSGLSQEQKKQKVIDMLNLTGIADAESCLKKYPHELSGGMRQRIMIAIALISRPRLLIADEPTTSLDVTIQAQILSQMKELQKKLNMAILLITHDLGIVADIADKIVVMYAGKIVEEGTTREIFYDPVHPYTKALLGSVPRLDREGKKMLRTIEGNIPDMTHPPKGCAFCERCPYAMNICEQYEPEERKISSSHRGACWLLDERAGKDGVSHG